MQVPHRVLGGGWLWHRIAAAWLRLAARLIHQRAGTVIGAYPRELRDLVEHRRRRLRRVSQRPGSRRPSLTRDQHDGGRAGAAALEIELAAAADVDPAGNDSMRRVLIRHAGGAGEHHGDQSEASTPAVAA